MNFVDISYYNNNTINDPDALLKSHSHSLGYLDLFPGNMNCSVVKFMNYEGERTFNKVRYYFFKGRSHFAFIPFRINRFLRSIQPDVVMVHGFIFPLQLIFLRRALGKKVIILVRHHGEQPGSRILQKIQTFADRFANGYLFTSEEQALPWIRQGVISSKSKIKEVLAGSTFLKKMDKQSARKHTGVSQGTVFLWVGRLDENKDPMTVVKAFMEYSTKCPGTYLYMIYQDDRKKGEVEKWINYNGQLDDKVRLLGNKPHSELEYWYNSADYFISGSHHEGSGFALVEAMACGCIPVITNIPSFRKITADGKYGYLYEAGNKNSLLQTLQRLEHHSIERISKDILSHYEKELSFTSIAGKIYEACKILIPK